MTTTSLSFPSFAKINWYLQILGKRADGYHEVLTVLQTVSLHDDLTFELRDDGEIVLSCDDPEIPLDASNLIVKAALELQSHLNCKLGADIKLIKRIPTRAGLGGASSNAAVTLMALNTLWDTRITAPDLISISSGLGADVRFFLEGGRGIATGIGADVSWIVDDAREPLIIVTPNARVSTANAYASLNAGSLTTSKSDPILSSSLAERFSADSRQWPLRNDFERVIFEIEPEIERAKMALLEAGARGALLTGSGSSVFGIFDNETARDRALNNLRREVGWRVFPCDTVTRGDFFTAMSSSWFRFIRSLKLQQDTGA
ncbi:MAG TPA: 4-(cytidine 5'-diphospho)-2-C-methyl-D-erythritol kinase [Pyrinomonadaceae bacterium]|nr:4-(cytidine 5'-diphospho)-2-C-methyl-D-erythritol kinase [Pyrinomonadaceae bacterium]